MLSTVASPIPGFSTIHKANKDPEPAPKPKPPEMPPQPRDGAGNKSARSMRSPFQLFHAFEAPGKMIYGSRSQACTTMQGMPTAKREAIDGRSSNVVTIQALQSHVHETLEG